MHTKHLSCLLPGKRHHHARIDINPKGFIRVNIVENKQSYTAKFEELCFECKGSIPSVVCCDLISPSRKHCRIYLSSDDARALLNSMVEAQEEYEILMRDL